MESPIHEIVYTPQKPLCLPAFSIFKLRVKLLKTKSVSQDNIKVNIRTNLGQAERIRAQIIKRVEEGFTHEWDFHDIPLRYEAETDEYCLDYLLDQVGYFEWKLFSCSADIKNPWDFWAPGLNHGISVFPASYKKDNSIYCAFIRQFSEDKTKLLSQDASLQDKINELEEMGCAVIQPSGTFEDFKKELPFIINKLGMRIIHILPINPVPQNYGRMGKYGSPYASLDFFAIDPVYAYFDRHRTIEEQFIDLASTIHHLGGRVVLDMPVNHTGWGSKISSVHLDWQVRKPDGEFVSPGAWGTVWEDLVELNHSKRELWVYLARMFITWCRRGVDGFRLDAGYKVPVSTWQYIIAKVREEYPQTFFLLEGLGGPMETTRELLTQGMMNFAYSELFQNYTKKQIEEYLNFASKVSSQDGILVHYAETHDNNRLAVKGKAYALMRLYLSAFTSFYGNWGFTNGVEWLAKEKIEVSGKSALNWGSKNNLVKEISRINQILNENPSFWYSDTLQVIETPWPNICVFYRANEMRNNFILIIANLDYKKPALIDVHLKKCGIEPPLAYPIEAVDLLDETTYTTNGPEFIVTLAKGQVRALRLQEKGKPFVLVPLCAEKRIVPEIDTIYRIMLKYFDRYEVGQIDPELLLSPMMPYRGLISYSETGRLEDFLHKNFIDDIIQLNKKILRAHSVIWNFTDKNKDFLIEGNKWLITSSKLPASVYLDEEKIKTVKGDDGRDWAIFPPDGYHKRSLLTFHWIDIHEGKINRRWENAYYPIYSLPDHKNFTKERENFHLTLSHYEILKDWVCVILANGRGSFLKTPLAPGNVHSKYDGLLIANFSTDYPEDRMVLVKCSQDILHTKDKFYELDARDCVLFTRYPVPTWRFDIRDNDAHFVLTKRVHLIRHENTTRIEYKCLEATDDFSLQVTFYVEWRSYHEETRAMDLENVWTAPFTPATDDPGFDFHPYEEGKLSIRANRGEFAEQPHWYDNFDYPMDATRGQTSSGDAYTPGYFIEKLKKGESIDFVLTTEKGFSRKDFNSIAHQESRRQAALFRKLPAALRSDPVARSLILALDQFIVKRGSGYTLIAGYPWFLDWGRDTLICVPGLLAAGYIHEVEGILSELAKFTENGMAPNTIFGETAGNYDTVDAPLWFLEAVRCYINATNKNNILSQTVKPDGTTMLEVLKDIVEGFAKGMKNNIKMDKKTGLIYSPSHFTWMDTQHPAGTPREGYPVEIQGLWINALRFLADNTSCESDSERYLSMADITEKSLWNLYWLENENYFADGIWAPEGECPADIPNDKALRPNQLILLYLNLVPVEKAGLMLNEIQKELVIPGAVRTLADKRIDVPLYIINSSGDMLSDPHYPYRGRYEGHEDTSRKPAYHNGAAWLWQYPYFVESLAFTCGNDLDSVQRALSYLAPSLRLLKEAAIGNLEEIRDGDSPHTPRGCFAQAWSVAELIRVYIKLRLKEIELSEEPGDTN